MKIYNVTKDGYHPFIIKEEWQIAKLNYSIEQSLNKIEKMEKHINTDEVFVLLEGKAILIEGTFTNNWEFKFHRMEKKKIYNVEAGTWHNIILFEDTETLIIEKNATHINDCTYKDFIEDDKKTLISQYSNYCNL